MLRRSTGRSHALIALPAYERMVLERQFIKRRRRADDIAATMVRMPDAHARTPNVAVTVLTALLAPPYGPSGLFNCSGRFFGTTTRVHHVATLTLHTYAPVSGSVMPMQMWTTTRVAWCGPHLPTAA
ncbi:hypothetical protein GCM10010985_29780 [Caballeronia grimmiae]|uniref:Uncharacterized protein n=1 Tax=Caballeronia grimmiae TaxID=1071679 RepID=A0ABQ1RP32_9BURK|nr:hypothetical protein GCM10010985_29780 [Caballeronia grimmiae]